MSTNLVGATVNAGGTKIATSKALGTGTLNTSNPANDHHTVIKVGSTGMTIKNAISAGLLRRNSSGVLEELNLAQPCTRVG
jgi:hypothetical protein